MNYPSVAQSNSTLRRDLPVIELGGALGVVACVTNKLLTHPTAHVVVEANPLAIPQLTLNKESNHCEFEVVNRAIAYGVDAVTFCPTIDLASNSIESDGTQLYGTEQPVTVRSGSAGKLVTGRGFSKFSLVCDIEGKEYDLVCNEIEILKKADVIIMETHARLIGEDKNKFLIGKLTAARFQSRRRRWLCDHSAAVCVGTPRRNTLRSFEVGRAPLLAGLQDGIPHPIHSTH